ncbi:hypothetical protein N0V84_006111 [Fusarium piperis]|uniref:Uncharacterized protein n=1 Tax=Fusarium piperis TaxID=1435070 RepID=A0A9W9BNV7_9HYPO|nr:hypothetical protein N0V84_006111 [Fusarium piperis]
MKFSAVALITLAHGILAMPQVPDKTNEIAKRSAELHNRDICWLACFPEKPSCPESWGECWTCCLGIEEK